MSEEDDRYRYLKLKQSQTAAPEGAPTLQDKARQFGAGVHGSLLRTGHGIQDLVGSEVTLDQKEFLEGRERVAGQSGWGTAGAVGGEIGQLALPASSVVKTVQMLPKALQTGKTILAGDVALGAGYGGLKLPKDGDTRSMGAAKEATATLTGGVLGGALRKTLTGINTTEAADELIKQNVKLTPAEASVSTFPRALEYGMNITPFVARGVKRAKERSTDTWNDVLLNKVAPLGERITERGVKGVKQLKDQFTDAYTAAWNKSTKLSNEALVDIVNTADSAREELGGASGMILKGVMADVKNLSKAADVGPVIKQLDNTLRKKLDGAARVGDEALSDTLKSIRAKLRRGAGSEVDKALKPIDAKYGDWIAVRDAASGKQALEAGGRIEPTQLMGGVKSSGGKTRSATGDAPLYDFAKQGVDTIGQKSPNPIIDLLKGWSVNTPSLLPLQTTGDAILGNTALQKTAKKGYDSLLAETLRNYGARGSILGGQALDEDQKD